MRRLTWGARREHRARLRALRRELRSWRRFRRDFFEAWALAITQGDLLWAETLRPFVDDTDELIEQLSDQLHSLILKGA